MRLLIILLFIPLLSFKASNGKYKTFYESSYQEGDLILVGGILFDVDKDGVRPESYDSIKPIADFLKRNPDYQVEIGVHTDDRGSAKYNKELSQRRAKQVAFIVTGKYEVEFYRARYKGYGEEVPLISADSIQKLPLDKREQAFSVNRRVEVKIVWAGK